MGTTVWDLKFNADASQAKAEVAALGDALTKSLKTMDMVGGSINANFEKSEKSMAMHARQGQKEIGKTVAALQAPIEPMDEYWSNIENKMEAAYTEAAYGSALKVMTAPPWEAAAESLTATMEDIPKLAYEGYSVWERMPYAIDKATGAVNNFNRRSVMGWMSLMWFAYSIKRALEGFARSAIDTFMKVTDSSNELNRGFTYLSATWEYFKFSFIDAALGPVLMILLPIIIDIVDKFVEWMDTNPDLSIMLGYLTLIGIALATVLFWLAQIKLAAGGVAALKAMFGGLTGGIHIFGYTISITFGTILAWILIIIAILAVLYLAWKNNFAGMQDRVTAIWNYLGAMVGNVIDIFKELFDMFDDLFAGNEEGWKTHLTNILKLIGQFAINAIGIFFEIGLMFYSIMVAAAKAALTGALSILATFYNTMAGLVEGLTGQKQFRMDVTQAQTAVENAAKLLMFPVDYASSKYKEGAQIVIDSFLTVDTATVQLSDTMQKNGDAAKTTATQTDNLTNSEDILRQVTEAQNTAIQMMTQSFADATTSTQLLTQNLGDATTAATTSVGQMTNAILLADQAQKDYTTSLAATAVSTMGRGGGGIPLSQLLNPGESLWTGPRGGTVISDTQPGEGWTMTAAYSGDGGTPENGVAPGISMPSAEDIAIINAYYQNVFLPRLLKIMAMNITGLQGGGMVSKAGLFNLHAGEAVVPAGDNYSYGGINISINNPVIRDEADIDELAKKVGDKIKDAISRRVRLV